MSPPRNPFADALSRLEFVQLLRFTLTDRPHTAEASEIMPLILPWGVTTLRLIEDEPEPQTAVVAAE